MAKSAVTKTRLLKSVNDTIKKLKLTDDVTTSQGVRFIYVDYKESVDDAVGKIITSLNRIYGVNKEFKEQTTIGIVVGQPQRNNETIKFRIIKESQGGVIPTVIQESGTTIIFNQVLRHNVKFKKKEDILNHPETSKSLKRVFGSYQDRLTDWTHTYFEQQQAFLTKYADSRWDEFEYGEKDFVTFFRDQIKNVARSLDPLKPVGDYTTWNPSDIWAVYEKSKVQQRITKNISPATQSLVELNALLIDLFKKEKLVGISLKKVASNKGAKIKLVNIDTKSMMIGKVEDFKMKDVQFEVDNIVTGEVITNTIKLGKDVDFKIIISKSGSRSKASNLSFNTFIKETPAAQGGQAPVKFVIELMNRKGSAVTFTNENAKYPKSAEEFFKTTSSGYSTNDFKKWYKVVEKHISKRVTYDDFVELICDLYKKDKQFIAQSKLMSLHFFYDTLRNHDKNIEFWTDLLYLGMKVGKRFAPHAKIS